MVRRSFRKNKRAVISLYILYAILFVFIFADFLAGDKPIICNVKGTVSLPVLKSYGQSLGLTKKDKISAISWKEKEYKWVVWPLIPYGPKEQDVKNVRAEPAGVQTIKSGYWRHWFGTDELGRDVLSAIIHATRVDILIGLVAMAVATFIGLLFGSLAGFFGDRQVLMPLGRLGINILLIGFGLFYAFGVRFFNLSDALSISILSFIGQLALSLMIFAGVIIIGNFLYQPFSKVGFLNKKVLFPVDMAVSRLIEIVVSVPVIFLIIMVLALVQGGSIFWVMLIIGLTRWTGIARFVRAELLKIRSLEYMEAAKSLGYSKRRMLFKHALPNALSPVFIAVAFGIASAILIEAFLSFMGLGTPPEILTWGKLLELGRQNISLWWLTVFPGIPIFVTVVIFNLIGEGLTDSLDPKVSR